MPHQEYISKTEIYVISDDLQFREIGHLQFTNNNDTFIVVEIASGGWTNGVHNNRYDTFKIYSPSGEVLDFVEANGWKLHFAGPHQSPYYDYVIMRYSFTDLIRTELVQTDPNVCIVRIETFIEALQKLLFYKDFRGLEIAKISWENKRLTEKNKVLQNRIHNLETQLTSCQNDLASLG
ncbi:hypothetical protein WG906_08765 [Pedobacter sp. P351]|uniref:hypothetical protein n=1 Tax=Pedobacter superstes TaxID=3133441 RepID=UPI00309686C1